MTTPLNILQELDGSEMNKPINISSCQHFADYNSLELLNYFLDLITLNNPAERS